MCVFVHTYMHIYIHMYVDIHIYTYIHIYTHTHTYTHIEQYLQFKSKGVVKVLTNKIGGWGCEIRQTYKCRGLSAIQPKLNKAANLYSFFASLNMLEYLSRVSTSLGCAKIKTCTLDLHDIIH